MNDQLPRFMLGIDVGTQYIRAVALSEYQGEISVIANSEVKNNGGMSKGVITNLAGPVESLNRAIVMIDQTSGKSFTGWCGANSMYDFNYGWGGYFAE